MVPGFCNCRGGRYGIRGSARGSTGAASAASDTAAVTVAGGNGQGSSANQFNTPADVFVDTTGDVYVVRRH
jgi:hypothetical protein